MSVGRVTQTSPIVSAGCVVSPRAANGASLLPDPCASSRPEDGLALIYAEISRMGQVNMKQSREELEGHQKVQAFISKQEHEALERARRAQSDEGRGFFGSIGHLVGDILDDVVHLRVADVLSDIKDDTLQMVNSPKFWQDLAKGAATIAKWAALVGTIAMGTAAIVASGGALGTCLVAGGGMALSVAGFAVQELSDNKAVQWVGLGMGLAGGLAAGIGSALTSKGGTELAKSIMVAGGVAVAAGGASGVVAGCSTIALGKFQEIAEDALADAKQARLGMERQERAIRELLDFANGMQKSNRRALESAQSAMQLRDQTQLAACSVKG